MYGYDLVSINLDGSGEGRWLGSVERRRPLVGAESFPVILDGRRSVRGELFRFDHLPAAWLFLPRTGAASASFNLDGRAFQVQR